MTHPSDLLSAYLDGELEPSEVSVVKAHVVDCGACGQQLAGLRSVRGAVRSLPIEEPPPGLLPVPRRRVASVAPWWRRAWLWAATATAAVAVLVGAAAVSPEPDTGFDLSSLSSQHVARVVRDPGVSTLGGISSGLQGTAP